MTLPSPLLLGAIYAISETIIGRTRRASKANFTLKDRQSLLLLTTVIWISVGFAALAAYFLPAARMPGAYRIYPIACALFAAGLLFRWYAIWILGRFFTVNVAIATDHRLVETGPYRYLRHPSYTGALLAFFALGLAMGNLVSLAFMSIPVFLVFRRRMQIEEEALLEAFGETYHAYMQRTKRLVPLVY
jgi:protein-S-isoprenylcysteine O-methyltransferase